MSALIRFYSDPAIGFPCLGWGIRFMRTNVRGFGLFWNSTHLGPPGVFVGFWRCRRVEVCKLYLPNKAFTPSESNP